MLAPKRDRGRKTVVSELQGGKWILVDASWIDVASSSISPAARLAKSLS